MHILHIGKYFTPFKGGIENMMLSLIKEQVRNGLKVSVLVHHHNTGIDYSETIEGGAKIYRIPIWGKLLFVPLALSAYRHIKKIIKLQRPDIVHAHLPNVSCLWLLFLPKKTCSKLVLHWHSDVIGERPPLAIKLLYPLYRVFEKAILRRADKIIVTSDNYLETSKPLIDFKHKCTVVPLGLDDITLKENREADFEVGALCIGRLTYYKGHDYLLQAMAMVPNHLPLTIVGSGDAYDRLTSLAKRLGITDRVRFLEHVDDIRLLTLISRCKFLVLPSIERTEAFGLVLLEAMRLGKACICTDVKGSGMSNVVQHLETGLVVEHANEVALAKAINTLHSDDALTLKLGTKGRERYLTQYHIEKVEALIRLMYESVLRRK